MLIYLIISRGGFIYCAGCALHTGAAVLGAPSATRPPPHKISLSEFRNESAFGEFFNSAKTVPEEVGATAEFSAPARPRPRKRFYNYEAQDEPITDAETHFKVNSYYYLLDTAITKFDERCELLNENNVIFSFLQKLKQWKDLDLDTKNNTLF